MTSRWLVALSMTLVPAGNAAEPLLPTATLMPAGLEVTRSPPAAHYGRQRRARMATTTHVGRGVRAWRQW
jgi:hypothetical protein